MQGRSNGREPSGRVWVVERAIVLQILRDDHEERWSQKDLVQEISDFETTVIQEALECMERDGVLDREGDAGVGCAPRAAPGRAGADQRLRGSRAAWASARRLARRCSTPPSCAIRMSLTRLGANRPCSTTPGVQDSLVARRSGSSIGPR